MEDDLYSPPRKRKNRKPKTKSCLPCPPLSYGYAMPSANKQLSLEEFFEVISDSDEWIGTPIILTYWARGSANTGDELKMQQMGIASYVCRYPQVFPTC